MRKHRKLWIILGIIATLFLCIGIGFCVYVNDYYRATDYAKEQTVSSESVTVYKDGDYYIFEPEAYSTGIIFYPGGKVEALAYAPLLRRLAEKGILCVLCEMPFHLAVFKENSADGIQEKFSVASWYLAGHSLGGAMAANYIAGHLDDYQGLILLAAYSAKNVSSSNLDVISIYGDQDGVLNREKYEESKKNLPHNFKEFVIEGGCHSYFGSYGIQAGDGEPVLTEAEQRERVVSILTANLQQGSLYRYKESIAELDMPDCGFYTPVYIKCTKEGSTSVPLGYLKYNALLHLRIDISAFSGKTNGTEDMDFTAEMLDALTKEFAKMDAASVSVIVRFAYDAGFNGNKNSEPSVEQIKRHIKALKPIFYAYEDMITAVEFGLIGPWGEMHSSTVANQTTYNTLIPEYLSATPESMKILLRRPKFVYSYYGYSLATLKDFSVSFNRLGVYNDGYLGSETDLGTYDDRASEVDWLSKLNEDLPYGGEVTVPTSSLNQLNNAVEEMFQLKLSYLNSLWNDQIIKRWKDTKYTGPEELYKDSNEYTYIKNHLGYRLVLQELNIMDSPSKLAFHFTLMNKGFGNLLKEKNAYLVFKGKDGIYSFEFENINMMNLNLLVDKKALPAGEYDIFFMLADSYHEQAKRSIPLANEGLWNEDIKGNLLFNRYKIGF